MHPDAPRVFISYRSIDGRDKATALARDLGERFGDAQVFLDKDDLAAGSRWRDAIARTLGQRPVLLLLITPLALSARDEQGQLRIAHPADPLRQELEAALHAHAHIVPLMCDGIDSPPQALPPPFDVLHERTWRPLRAYDWRHDVERIATDLQALGIGVRAAARRRLGWAAGGLALAGVAGVGAWRWLGRDKGDPRTALEGHWLLRIGPRGGGPVHEATPALGVRLQRDDTRWRLDSAALDIEHDPEWTNYRDYWAQRTGQALRRIVYRGEGPLQPSPGGDGPPVLSLAMRIEPQGLTEAIDGGQLRGHVDSSGQRIAGRLWVNSEQGERRVVLQRAP